MNTLSQHMQERLDKWRTKPTTVKPTTVEHAVRRGGKGDHGDIISVEQWEEEIRKSQTRK